jgi:lipopolysaccharide/colanic/teichoic acid biosynthesis glycosyltransferase
MAKPILKNRREKSPTPLLLSPKSMELTLTKERMRCDRHGHFFSLIVIQIKSSGAEYRSQVRLLAKMLHKRLRLTDEKGLLLKGGLGVLLPMTDWHGAKVVVGSIRQTAAANGLAIEAEVFTYSGRENSSNNNGSNLHSDSDSEIILDEVSSLEDTVVETSRGSVGQTVAKMETTSALNRIVRADNQSQTRQPVASKIAVVDASPSTHFFKRYPTWKRCMDVTCAVTGLTISLPFVLLAAVAIKLTSRGPIFFRQFRTGQFGNPFTMYKLRTMVVEAEEMKEKLQRLNERDGPAFKMKNDPRVTTVGGILRKTGLDELPQLWNVLIGDMAIVGPRPLPCNEDAQCEVWQRRRLDTKPGLTCIWQISKSRKISFSDWMRMDLKYADKRTVSGDIQLMFKTVMAVFLGRVGH